MAIDMSVQGPPIAPSVHSAAGLRSYHVDLPLDLLDDQGSLLDWVIAFVFDTLDARHLELRIVPEARSPWLSGFGKCNLS